MSEPSHSTTEHLLKRSNEGDQSAFSLLIERHVPRLLLYLKRKLAGCESSDWSEEDACQVVCARAWELLPRFTSRGPGSFYRWLSTLARHVVNDRLKYLEANGRGEACHLESVESGALRIPLDSTVSVASIAAGREMVRRLEDALESLLPVEREVLSKYYLEGSSLAEVASQLGIPKTTAWARLRKSLLEVRKRLESATKGLPELGRNE